MSKFGKNQETVEVVIPTFEDPDRTLRAVQSVLAQSAPISQIHVMDDGSSAKAAEIMNGTLRLTGEISLHRLSHSGHPGHVRRQGVERVSSKWVAFLDADDYWDPDKIRLQLQVADKTGAGLVFSNSWREVGDSKTLFFTRNTDLPIKLSTFRLLMSNAIINSSVLVKKNHLDFVGGFADSPSVRAVEDYATWLRLSVVCDLVGIREPLLTYTDSATSFSKLNHGVSPVLAIRDFRHWLIRSNVPWVRRLSTVILATLMIQYHRLYRGLSKGFAHLTSKDQIPH